MIRSASSALPSASIASNFATRFLSAFRSLVSMILFTLWRWSSPTEANRDPGSCSSPQAQTRSNLGAKDAIGGVGWPSNSVAGIHRRAGSNTRPNKLKEIATGTNGDVTQSVAVYSFRKCTGKAADESRAVPAASLLTVAVIAESMTVVPVARSASAGNLQFFLRSLPHFAHS
jgi:hypothetical protein